MNKQEYMYKEVEEYLESNLLIREFILTKKYTYYSFKYWLKKYRDYNTPSTDNLKQPSSNNFKEIYLSKDSAEAPKLFIELQTESGTHIKIYQ